MIKTLKQITQMKAALWVNAFCYYFKRLWVVGKWMPESIYSDYRLKKVLSVIAVILRQLIDFFGKPLYLLMVVGFPFILLAESSPSLKDHGLSAMVQILFFLNCGLGAFGDSQIFTVTRDKITCIKYLHMSPRKYIQSILAFKYIPFFLYYLPWLIILVLLLGGTFLQGLFVWLMLFSFRMIGEAVHLLIFDRTGKVISRNTLYDWLLICGTLLGAYLPVALGWNLPFAAVMLHPLSVAVYTALGGYCLWYITVGYQRYGENFHRSIDINFLLSTLLKTSTGSTASFKEVEIKEKDLIASDSLNAKLENLRGFSYFNALFFVRHKRQLIKPVYYRFMAVAVAFAAALIFLVLDRERAVRVSEHITALMPVLVYVMYFMTVADKASRAMFYNCDKDMLRYAYYRRPQTILKNFQIRLFRISLYDAAIAGAVCLAAIVYTLLCGTPVFTLDMLLFCATILLLSVLFTTHHLCLYYIFQPYSESLKVKNPFFSVINVIMYVICFMCLQIKAVSITFTLSVLGFTVLYIVVALVLVYRFAPKTFRVK